MDSFGSEQVPFARCLEKLLASQKGPFTISVLSNRFLKQQCKRYSSPVTGLEWPRGFQEVKVPRFRDKGTEWW